VCFLASFLADDPSITIRSSPTHIRTWTHPSRPFPLHALQFSPPFAHTHTHLYTRFKALSRPITHAYHLRNECIIRNHPTSDRPTAYHLAWLVIASFPIQRPFPPLCAVQPTDADAPPTFHACCFHPLRHSVVHCLCRVYTHTLQLIKPSNALHLCGYAHGSCTCS
jgi:hypothetical protein